MSKIVIIILLILIPVAIFKFPNLLPQKNSNSDQLTSELTSELTSDIKTPENEPKSKTRTFPHELLMGFNVNIPTSWIITDVKQFGENDTIGFKSSYYSSLPNQNSMAVRIFKNSAYFDLIFDLVFDNNNVKCSNDLGYTDIGNGWFRIEDNNETFYTQNLKFNYKNAQVDNEIYKTCILGSGVILNARPGDEISPSGDGALMLEDIYLYGSSLDEINEVDQIVRSITGVNSN